MKKHSFLTVLLCPPLFSWEYSSMTKFTPYLQWDSKSFQGIDACIKGEATAQLVFGFHLELEIYFIDTKCC